VGEYIEAAVPISSRAISDNYDLGVSPATIRSEMAALEDRGYLTHPHTSAGRVSTEQGYRYFVEKLMGESSLALAEQRTINHQFHQARLDVDQWMRLAAAVLAHKAQGAAWITAPRSTQCRLKHMELISIHDSVALLILVLQAGIVKQQILTLSSPRSQDQLSRVAHRLTDRWAGCNRAGVAATLSSLTDFENLVADMVLDTMRRMDARTSSDVYRDGLLNILNQPEFVHNDSAHQIVRALEERQFVEELIGEVMQQGGLQIIIGGEGRWEDLSEVSVVLARYGVASQATGTLGVLGPIRMQYRRTVSVVRYMSQLMSEMVSDLHGR